MGGEVLVQPVIVVHEGTEGERCGWLPRRGRLTTVTLGNHMEILLGRGCASRGGGFAVDRTAVLIVLVRRQDGRYCLNQALIYNVADTVGGLTNLLVVPAGKHHVCAPLRQRSSGGLPYARVRSRDHTHPSRHGVAGWQRLPASAHNTCIRSCIGSTLLVRMNFVNTSEDCEDVSVRLQRDTTSAAFSRLLPTCTSCAASVGRPTRTHNARQAAAASRDSIDESVVLVRIMQQRLRTYLLLLQSQLSQQAPTAPAPAAKSKGEISPPSNPLRRSSGIVIFAKHSTARESTVNSRAHGDTVQQEQQYSQGEREFCVPRRTSSERKYEFCRRAAIRCLAASWPPFYCRRGRHLPASACGTPVELTTSQLNPISDPQPNSVEGDSFANTASLPPT